MSPAARQPFRHFALLDALQHAVIATDTRGRIIDWSASAEVVYGWKRDEVMGRDILEVTPSSLSRTQAAAIMETLRSGDVWSGDFRVRRRHGDDFLASVTTGIVGLSAPAGTRTRFSTIAKRFVDSCDRLWPGAVSLESEIPEETTLTVSDPHLIQLMALLIIRQAPAMDKGSHVKIAVRTANSADVADFGRVPSGNAVVMRFAWSDHEMLQSPLDRFVSTAARSSYIAKLVGMTGGILLRGFDQTHWRVIHVILPREER
jgi:PAS domain S-box-containing protein